MITIYDKDEQTVAVVLNKDDYMQQVDKRFFSYPADTIQVGSLFFPKNSSVAPHIHKQKEPSTNPMEVLMVLRGKVSADIYDNNKQIVTGIELKMGDILIQKCGGHGFKFNSKTVLLEIKQGPYYGRDSDKELIKEV